MLYEKNVPLRECPKLIVQRYICTLIFMALVRGRFSGGHISHRLKSLGETLYGIFFYFQYEIRDLLMEALKE
jgi:hypothetical protein